MEREDAISHAGQASTSPGDCHTEFNKQFLPFHGVENNTQAYLPLDPNFKQIRYIAIDRGTGDEPLSCFLGYVSLLKGWKQPFQAVSYCWGDTSDTVEISLRCAKTKSATVLSSKNASTVQQYKVTRNLDALLRAFRLQYAPKFLWVDAICINQGDAAEKTHQVGAMSTIYSAATNVLVWLGEADIFSELLIKSQIACDEYSVDSFRYLKYHTLESLRQQVILDKELRQLFSDAYNYEHENKTDRGFKLSIDSILPVVRRSLDRCLSRPWFRRIWVLQEVVLAPVTMHGLPLVTVYMGNSQIQWDRLVNFARKASEPRSTYNSSDYGNLLFFNNVWSRFTIPPQGGPISTFPIEEILSMTTTFAASDPRDKLFAILQLAKDTRDVFKTNDLLRPDYSKSLSRVLSDYRRWQLSGLCVTCDSAEDGWEPTGTVAPPRGPSIPNGSLNNTCIDEETVRGAESIEGDTARITEAAFSQTITNHVPAVKVDFDCQQHYFRDRQALDYLVATQRPKNPSLGPKLPTWVTNVLAGVFVDQDVNEKFLNDFERYNASGAQIARQIPTGSPFSISLQGQIIGRIQATLTPLLSQVKQLHTLASYLSCHSETLWNCSTRDQRAPNPRVRTIKTVHQRAMEDFGVHEYEESLKVDYSRTPRFTALGLPYKQLFYPRHLSQQYLFTVGSPPIQGTQMSLTTQEEFVLTSANAVAGDMIAIIYGGRVPLLLRPEPRADDRESQKYRFIGPCFFYRDKWMLGKEVKTGQLPKERNQFFELV